ncbi:hypothetical protein PHSY_001779 [Pseudozyma hubeiensis SY62]|uniref:Uncharacterized protein n=1 Tax=Pseudozyma hubeiensis (strain SY62) TaxID=1305764 RepID=R9NZC9_PSEHS|nr:hypothetical protein PHSY_001779 [Pseudozyma hubeiensis SY62]GAC94208.1 hypothetical protein PHSY_001779 [Pseudozyma hubeiensis SY62]
MSSVPDARYTGRMGEGLTEAQLYELAKTYAGRMAQGADVGPLRDMPHAELLAIGMQVEGDPLDQLDALIKRLGFYPHQQEQVKKVLEVAFHTFLAMQLVSSGTTWPATFDSFDHENLTKAMSVLDAHPLMHNLMHPPASFYEGMADVLKKDPHLPSEAVLETVRQGVRVREEGMHQTLVKKALSMAIQLQYTTASQTWLSVESQRNATHRSQWEQLRGMTRI